MGNRVPSSRRRTCQVTALVTALTVTFFSGVPASARAGYGWPLRPRPAVVTAFDAPAVRWQAGHRGVDLDGPVGSAVLAAAAGTVAFAGPVAGKPVVSIRHPDGLLTTYEPVVASVRAGTAVRRGDVIGTLDAGHPGCPVTACLHWGARRGFGSAATYLNPLSLVDAVRVRLKPLA